MLAEERIKTALHSSEPVLALRALVMDLARDGRNKTEIYGLLEIMLARVRTESDFREKDEDAVLDVMDALTGSCHPNAELLPEKPAL